MKFQHIDADLAAILIAAGIVVLTILSEILRRLT
jgi:hypothetical protein